MGPTFLIWMSLLLPGLSFPRAQGIKCYKCYSQKNKRCLSSLTRKMVIECGAKQECITLTVKDEENHVTKVVRDCGDRDQKYPKLKLADDKTDLKKCQKDKCNDAPIRFRPGGGNSRFGGGKTPEAATASTLAVPVCTLALSFTLALALTHALRLA